MRRALAPITDQAIACDTEIDAALAAHIAALDPHFQYIRVQKASKTLSGARTFAANTWASLGTFPGFSLVLQADPGPVWVGIRVIFDVAAPWQEARCGAWLSPVWWQPIVPLLDSDTRVFLAIHNTNGYYCYIRPSRFSDAERGVEFFPETQLVVPATGRVDINAVRLLLF